METYGLAEAAKVARCHPDTLRKLARAREVPATKIGREWVFPVHLLNDWIDARCRSFDVPAAPTGGSALAARLAAQLAQRTDKRPRSLRGCSPTVSGDSAGSETAAPSRGA